MFLLFKIAKEGGQRRTGEIAVGAFPLWSTDPTEAKTTGDADETARTTGRRNSHHEVRLIG